MHNVLIYLYACNSSVCLCLCMFYTYYVPTTLVVLSWVWPSLNIRAMPKSEILGFISTSSKTLLVLRSLWIIFNLESWWRYKIPRAIPIMISKRLLQFRNELPVWSTIKFVQAYSKCDVIVLRYVVLSTSNIFIFAHI